MGGEGKARGGIISNEEGVVLFDTPEKQAGRQAVERSTRLLLINDDFCSLF